MKTAKIAITLVAVSLAAICGATPAKDPVSGTGLSHLDPTYPPSNEAIMRFVGTVELVVRGEQKTADLEVYVISVAENEGGVQHVTASHVLTFADGSSIKTCDKEVAVPTDVPGVYMLNGNLKVVSGTGVYEGVAGHLSAHGIMDFTALPTASFEIRGAISSSAFE